MHARFAIAVALALASTPVFAGNFGDGGMVDGNGSSGYGANVGPNRSTEMGGGMSPEQLYRGQVEAIRRNENLSLGGFVDSMYRGMQTVGGWFSVQGGSDRSLSDGNGVGATGLAGGSCCSSDRLED